MDDKDRGNLAGGQPSPADAPDVEYSMTIKEAGGSKTRLVLLLLLLVAAGGAYFFLMMGEPEAPPPPSAVAVRSPAPATAPAGSLPNTVSIAPPPRPESPAAPAPVPASPAPAPAPVAATPAPVPVEAGPAPTAVAPAGAWRVEAGAYLDDAVLKSVVARLRSLGYEAQVDTRRRQVTMTRLRLWDVPAADVKEALAYARGLAPDAFALRSGDLFTVYAGTFATSDKLRQMAERLASEGVIFVEEPVLVTQSLKLVRILGFTDRAAAAEAAARVRQAGIAAEVGAPR